MIPADAFPELYPAGGSLSPSAYLLALTCEFILARDGAVAAGDRAAFDELNAALLATAGQVVTAFERCYGGAASDRPPPWLFRDPPAPPTGGVDR